MFGWLEITNFTYFRLKFESETETVVNFYSVFPIKEAIGKDAFVAHPDGVGVGVSTYVGVVL